MTERWSADDGSSGGSPEDAVVTPPPSEEAAELFGARLGEVERYAALLAEDGVRRGLIGPREVPRLWDRHLVNSGLLAEAIPVDASVCDVGTGAGLPGLVLALTRPDLRITLLEPLLRRTTFLDEAVDRLDVRDRVRVVRARAEEHDERYSVVVARAVAPLDRLLGWTLRLCEPDGVVLAMKGERANEEVAAAEGTLRRWDAASWSVRRYGAGLVEAPLTVVRVVSSNRRQVNRPGRGARRRR